MKGSTHFTAGAAVGLVALIEIQGIEDPDKMAVAVMVSAISALVPDWLQINIPGINGTIKGFAGHRGFSHWLLTAWAVYSLAVAISPSGWWSQVPPWAILAGWISHIALDAFNDPGVPAFWPLPWRLHVAGIKTGGTFDRVIGACCGVFAGYLLIQVAIGAV